MKRLTCVAAFLLTQAAHAQLPASAASMTAAAVIDSQAVLRTLDAALRANTRDATSWYRRGMIAWALAERADAKPAIRGLNAISMKALADSSLKLAVEYAPKRAQYQLSIGTFYRLHSDAISRFEGIKYFDAAVELARAPGTDSVLHSLAAIEAGRVRWLRYEGESHQIPYQCPIPQSIDSARVIRPRIMDDTMVTYLPTEGALKMLHNALIDCPTPKTSDVEGDYMRAEELFREAYAAMPSNDRAFRQLEMLLADKDRWREVATVARDRVIKRPKDAWAWLDLGLAMHRTAPSPAAVAVFDTGSALLDARERGRLFSFTRMLQHNDSARFASSNVDAQREWEGGFWQMANPLWSRPGLDPRTEFIARVVFAELRWTVDELGVRGADSDRGEIHIRFGHPDRIAALRGCNTIDCAHRARCTSDIPEVDARLPATGAGSKCYQAVDGTFWRNVDPIQSVLPTQSAVVTIWDYDNGLTIAFWGEPTYGTAHFPATDGIHIERALEIRSAGFDNLVRDKLITMNVAATRFRAPGDSVDLLLISLAPVKQLREGVANAQLAAHTWLLGSNDDEYRDSTAVHDNGVERAVYRVSPARYLYHVEVNAPGTSVSGRGMRWIAAERDTTTGFSLKGFGVSDVLVATVLQPASRVPVRWSDFNAAPLLGEAKSGSTVELLWENYDVGARDGQTRYSVSITLQRERSSAGKIAASLLGFAANAVGVKRADDRIIMTYERGGPAAPAAFAEHISLGLGETPPGEYRLLLEITDRTTGRKARSESTLTIAK